MGTPADNTDVTIANGTGTNTLTIGGGGITVNSTSATHTISANLVLGASQAWANGSTGLFTVSGSTVTGSNTNLTVSGTGSTTISAAIQTGAGTLTKGGAGTLTLSGTTANTYSGLTSVSGGELDLNKTAGVNAIAGDLTVTSGTVKLLANDQIANASNLTVNGATAVFELNGKTETVGGVSLQGGGSIQDTATGGALTSGTAFDMQSGTASAVLAGGVGLNKTTAGLVTLSGTGANTYSGLTSVSGGELDLNKTAGVNAIAGDLTVTSGTVKLLANDQIANASNLTVNGATAVFELNGKTETVGGVSLQGGGSIQDTATGGALTSGTAFDVRNGTISAALAGSVGLNKTTTDTVTLSGANLYTGTTTVSAGTLILSGGAAIVNTGAVSMAPTAGATLQLNASERIGSLSGGAPAGGNVNLQGFTLTVGDSNNTTYAGALSGSGGGLTKVGSGKLELSGANTYSGATSVQQGTLAVSGSTSGSAVSVDSGAILNLTGTVTTPSALTIGGKLSGGGAGADVNSTSPSLPDNVSNTIAVSSGGTVSPGTGTAFDGIGNYGTLRANAFASNTGATLTIEIDSLHYDKILVGSSIDLNALNSGAGTTLNLVINGGSPDNLPNLTKFFIMENTGAGAVHGTFSNPTTPKSYTEISGGPFNTIVNGVYQDIAISYTGNAATNSFTGGNDVVLMVTPEPNAWTMLAGSLGMALGLQRFRRRRHSLNQIFVEAGRVSNETGPFSFCRLAPAI